MLLTFKKVHIVSLAFSAALMVLNASASAQTNAVLVYDTAQPPIAFAAGDLVQALRKKGFNVSTATPSELAAQTAPVQVIVTTGSKALPGQPAVGGLSKEGYAIRRVVSSTGVRWWAIGNDAPGAMYAGLELADAVEIDGSLNNVADKQAAPQLATRGIKFNIPLDKRTPTYASNGTAEQGNIVEMWNLQFWTQFLDAMARNRLNTLSLWNLNPFPSLVRIPEYPNASIDDVQGSSGQVVKTLTIDEKIAFWRRVMQYAKDRGVDVSFITWNIFVKGTENSGYGFTESWTDTKTKDYLRKAVRSLFSTYPLLAGIGVTAGENMGITNDADQEKWLWETYGLGVSDAVAASPGRKVNFWHRLHQTSASAITAGFSALPGFADGDSGFKITHKYAQAHMYSTTRPLFIQREIDAIPSGRKMALELRNDDMYNMRWGDPDFARTYINNFPDRSKVEGFLMGPDGYVWGREVTSKTPDSPRQLFIDKMWYSFAIWGRLAYDATVPNSRFQDLLGARYPEVPSGNLYSGFAAVSKILPLYTRFFWGDLDFKWYPEASMSNNGYLGVQKLIDPLYPPMTSSQDGQAQLLMSVKDHVNGVPANGRLSPLDVASLLHQYATTGIDSVSGLSAGTNKDLNDTLGDVKAMAWLGRYYAEKILGAVDLYRYQKTGSAESLAAANAHLQNAANHWRQYATQWSSQYQAQRLSRIGAVVDMVALQAAVDKDIPGGAMPPPPPPITTAAVQSFTVVNADTGAELGTFTGSATLATRPTHINLRANTVATSSVVFTDSTGYSRSEGTEPFAYKGNVGPVYNKWAPTDGVYVINATPYSNAGAAGTRATLTLTLGAAAPPPPAPAPTTYDVTGFVLVNASNGQAIRTLLTNDTINFATLGVSSISIQALAAAGAKSVQFSGAGISRTESAAPYALLGNSGPAYTPWTPAAGTYSITATGFSASNATGTKGNPQTITLNVVR